MGLVVARLLDDDSTFDRRNPLAGCSKLLRVGHSCVDVEAQGAPYGIPLDSAGWTEPRQMARSVRCCAGS